MDDDRTVLYENDYYEIKIGDPVLVSEDTAPVYQVISKENGIVEFEDHLFPAAIQVAVRAEQGIQMYINELEEADDGPRLLVPDNKIIQ